jgi:tellurite resistance protein TehA-like permease
MDRPCSVECGCACCATLNFAAAALWLCGGMVYVWVISLIFYRYVFFHLAPKDLAPTYWISMGAMAISALAGALLMLNTAGAPFLAALLPVLAGGTRLLLRRAAAWVLAAAGLVGRLLRERAAVRA